MLTKDKIDMTSKVNELYVRKNMYYCEKKVRHCQCITEDIVIQFAELSGDMNPVHLDEKAASESVFGKKIAHGMLVASYISKVLGMDMPGPGTIYMKQDLTFLRPVYIGDTIKVDVEIIEMQEKGKALLSTNIYNQNDEKVVEGTALVKLPKKGN